MVEYLKSLLANPREAVKSALRTAVAVAAVLAAVQAAGVSVPADLFVWTAGAVTVLRTILAAIDPTNGDFGRGA